MSTEPDDDPNADEFTERTETVKQAFQCLLGDETPVIIWGAPRIRDNPVLAHPCQRGHAWAWLTAGGQECYHCGMRR